MVFQRQILAAALDLESAWGPFFQAAATPNPKMEMKQRGNASIVYTELLILILPLFCNSNPSKVTCLPRLTKPSLETSKEILGIPYSKKRYPLILYNRVTPKKNAFKGND